jgi:hypothetical protein
MVSFFMSRIFGSQYGDAIRRSADVTQDQWQDPLSNAAETHKYDPALKIHMHFVFGHDFFPNSIFLYLMKKSPRIAGASLPEYSCASRRFYGVVPTPTLPCASRNLYGVVPTPTIRDGAAAFAAFKSAGRPI